MKTTNWKLVLCIALGITIIGDILLAFLHFYEQSELRYLKTILPLVNAIALGGLLYITMKKPNKSE